MCFNKEMWGKIMNYIFDYISEERKKEIADMNIVDTYNRTGYLDIPGDKVVKSKDEYFLFWYNSPDTLCLRQQIEETGSSSIGKKRYMLIYGDKYMDIEIPNENWKKDNLAEWKVCIDGKEGITLSGSLSGLETTECIDEMIYIKPQPEPKKLEWIPIFYTVDGDGVHVEERSEEAVTIWLMQP